MFKKSIQDLQASAKLPDAVMAIIRAVCEQARNASSLKIGTKPTLGGLRILFCGDVSLAKTVAARWIAHELGRELLRIDLAAVVSKYIGETEKHLNRLFNDAQASDIILFFDEADALFGKRSEVKDSHDRYANIEVSYLLQRIEAFAGLTILACNKREQIDPAFLRRLHYVIDLP
jgi:SpoVK/Ycf46/Vps4 family AAA+-type ATPase